MNNQILLLYSAIMSFGATVNKNGSKNRNGFNRILTLLKCMKIKFMSRQGLMESIYINFSKLENKFV